MLFDLGPKEKVEDLFGRKEQLNELGNAIKNKEKLVVVYGLRRVGKTSLLHVFLNEKEIPYVLIDVRELYLENGYISVQILSRKIIQEFENFLKQIGIKSNDYFDFDAYGSIPEILKKINQWSKERSAMFVIAFDEAQYLRFSGRTKYDVLLAWSVDNLSNIAYILTGSEIGMLKDFLRYDDVKAALYGRFRDEILIAGFDSDKSKKFLMDGFKEIGMTLSSDEVEDAVANIDGIAGWLTYYGNYRYIKKLSHKEALQKIYTEGSKITLAELERLIEKSRSRYTQILKAIANGADSWSNIKDYVILKSGKISDARFTGLIESLIKFGFIEKVESKYSISDPILSYAIKNLKSSSI